MPVHSDAHVESRENASTGGAMTGDYGGPMVVTTLPSACVLLPKPQVGQARSLMVKGARMPVTSMGGSLQTAPIAKFSTKGPGGGGFHVDSPPGGKEIIGLVRTGPTVVH